MNPAKVRTYWEEYAQTQEKEHDRVDAQLDSSAGGCRAFVQRARKELATVGRMLQHPALGPAVAPEYQYAIGEPVQMFFRCRVELMLIWAAQKLDLKWRVETRAQLDDGSIRVHVGPAVFRLCDTFVLQLARERSCSGRDGNPEFKAIERVVLVALWNEIPKEFWPKGLTLPKLTLEDATAATGSRNGALRRWVVTAGAKYLP